MRNDRLVRQGASSDLGERKAVRPSTVARPDAETDHAIRTFLQRLAEHYAVEEAILFGSRARQAHRVDSDLDLAVVIEGPKGDRSTIARDMAGMAFDVMLETGILVDALPLWRADFGQAGGFSNPSLLENIRRDGLRV